MARSSTSSGGVFAESTWAIEDQVEDFLFLVESGEHIELALKRVGAEPDTMAQRLRRLGKVWPGLESYRSELARERAAARTSSAPVGRRVSRKARPGVCAGGCGRRLWRYPAEAEPGSVKHAGRGFCSTCRSRRVAWGEW